MLYGSIKTVNVGFMSLKGSKIMRHRIGGLENVYMGLGADNIPYELDNTLSGNKALDAVADKMLDDAVDTLFSEIGGFDYKVTANNGSFKILFGREPAYKHDPYQICTIATLYNECNIKRGTARGYYGKDVEIEYDKNISDIDCDKAFVEFVDKWHPQLLEAMNC